MEGGGVELTSCPWARESVCWIGGCVGGCFAAPVAALPVLVVVVMVMVVVVLVSAGASARKQVDKSFPVLST